jgi:hypothetical protein
MCYPSVTSQKERIDMSKIRLQMEFRPALPVVIGNKDYREQRALAERIDDLLTRSGLEAEMIEKVLGPRQAVSAADWARAWRQTQIGLRCTIARHLTIKAYRVFSARLADSPLWQWFCRIDQLEGVRVPSKSALQRYEAQWSAAEVRGLVQQLNQLAARPAGAERLGLCRTLDVGAYFVDTTCVKANIHFPVDWVLLRDAARTLLKGMIVIRKHGLRQRMPVPGAFLRQMNRLSIAMTQGRRRPDSRRERKRVLRQMKRLSQVIRRHAQRHVAALYARRIESDLTEGQATQIIRRMENVLAQLPAAIKQAHERIIGGRQVANADKLLSLYERDLHVLVRGKADAEVEFGNTLFLAEQGDGMIVDWKLQREISLGDGTLLDESLDRMAAVFGAGAVTGVGGDRGFDRHKTRQRLEQEHLFNGICPRDPQLLRERMREQEFRAMQWRRAQTEGRIGIFKNDFLERPFRSKGFAARERSVAWSVLAHNLWILSELQRDDALKKAA